MYKEFVDALETLNINPDQQPRFGIVGGEDINGNYAINVTDEPNKIYVQFIDGLTQPQTEAVNYGVPLIPEFPVLVYYRNKEAYAVIDPDRAIDFRSQNEGLGNVAPHSHEPGSGNFDLVSTRRMKEGIVTVTLPYSMSVDIEGFKFFNPTTGEERWFPGGSLDVNGYIPGTANTHRWVKIGFDPSIEELVAESGAEYPSPVLLTEDQLAEIAFGNRMSLAGIELYDTITTIDDDKLIHDWRFFLNTIVTGVGGGDASGGVEELADLSDVLSATQTANWVLAVGDGVTGGLLRTRALVEADISPLNASKISTGILDDARIPNLDTAKITSGVFEYARLPFNAVKLISDTTSFNGADIDVIFTSELLDTDSYADLGGDPDRFTIPSAALAGWYRVNVTGTFLDLDSNLDIGWATIMLKHNDGGTNPEFFFSTDFDFAGTTNSYAPGISFELLLDMADTDFITMKVSRNVALAGDLYLLVYLTAQKIGD